MSLATAAIVVLHMAMPVDPVLDPPRHNGKVVSVTRTQTGGITLGVTSTIGGDRASHMGTFALSSLRVIDGYDRGLIVHLANGIDLGGNARGFHGGLVNELAGGYRFAVTETGGPFIRGGVEARLSGDSLLYRSLLELPKATAGYQIIQGRRLFELAGHAGLSLFGRSNTGDAGNRHIDQVLTFGALGAVHTAAIDLRATWSRFAARGPGGPIDWLDTSLCATAHHPAVALCATSAWIVGDVHLPNGDTTWSRAAQIGVTLGGTAP